MSVALKGCRTVPRYFVFDALYCEAHEQFYVHCRRGRDPAAERTSSEAYGEGFARAAARRIREERKKR